MRVTLDVEEGDPPSLIVGTPEPLFDWQYLAVPSLRPYDLSSNGRRFLVVGREASADAGVAAPHITVVLNWHQELLERVPVN